MPLAAFTRHLRDYRFREVLGRYVSRVFAAMAQSTACVAFHPVQERLARWLLMVSDALERDEFTLTQDSLAVMLGTHRPTVSIAVGILEKAGLLSHRRGVVRIIDKPGLTEASCECYQRIRDEQAAGA
jgi:CRP-like cAMP-binding protein